MILMTMSAALAAELTVTDPDGCLDALSLSAELSEVEAAVSVTVAEGGVALTATAPDGRLWSRTLDVSPADCPHLAPVVARSVVRGLAALPELPEPELEVSAPASLRPYRSTVSFPVATSIGLSGGSQATFGTRLGLRWDSGLTLAWESTSTLSSGADLRLSPQAGWTLPVGRFSPELTAGLQLSFVSGSSVIGRLSIPADFSLQDSGGVIQIGPTLSCALPLAAEEAAQASIGAALTFLPEHRPRRR